MNRRKQGDVSWYLPNSKRPFAYSTIAEADTVAILLEEFGDLRAVVSANRILSQQEKIIIQTLSTMEFINRLSDRNKKK